MKIALIGLLFIIVIAIVANLYIKYKMGNLFDE